MTNRLFARKPVSTLLAEAADTEHGLKRALGPLNLVTLGIGAIIGAGIFVLTGTAASQYAGPAVVLSFILAGIGCAFAGLCYAEMVAMIPVAGSAYTYAYATLGELVAWIIGWDLILEYSVGTVAVSVGWSGFFVGLLHDLGLNFPAALSAARGTQLIEVPGQGWQQLSDQISMTLLASGVDPASLPHATALLNIPAMLVVAAVTALLVIGVRESANVNSVIVILKVGALLAFIVAGIAFLLRHPDVLKANWSDFIPANKGTFGAFGWSGILRGAGVIFFAYIGFDAISTEAQEAKNPQRDMPIGILGSLVICTIIYILVGAVLTGLVHYDRLNVPNPVGVGLDVIGTRWLSVAVGIAAIGALSSAMLVMLMSQPRVFWAMAKDGLLPPMFAKIHPRFRTPYVTTIVTGLIIALFAGITTIADAGQLVSIGTLLAFVLVCLGVLVLRRTHPDTPRPFRAPLGWFTPVMGIVICLAQMVGLPGRTWLRLVGWLAVGLVIYFLYGMKRSKLAGVRKAG
ncbi:MAG: amino acid permease [Gemmatimonadetes bacterium]|nr:amino acid permease [Gemmatimonadota bacterium]